MIRIYRTIVVGSYIGGVYRPVRYIRIPYTVPYPTGRATSVAAGTGEVLVQGGAASAFNELPVQIGAGEVLVQGGATGIHEEDTGSPGAGEILVQGGQVAVSYVAPVVATSESDTHGSGGQHEWFERRVQEDEIVLQVVLEFLRRAA